ncbi:GNAT family N-acetyltransferase [Kiloniella sp. EL199]|uniref:GNAT family N-acetyltransferase n=1 Tax=Kiloniella sp. EL199 TaxID=2107581 RepID=UPI000EA244A4|nr:GNAT family N-acetyltransferase [Kiloniella sp. EL199]
MIIRPHKPEDAVILFQLFYDTVHKVNIQNYSQEQVDAWAPENFDIKRWQERTKSYFIFVAEDDSGITGFAELEENGHIDCFYVHHKKQGLGIGGKLMSELEQKAKDLKLTEIYAEVSITARPFFEKKEFKVTQKQEVVLRGQSLMNYKMSKSLGK